MLGPKNEPAPLRIRAWRAVYTFDAAIGRKTRHRWHQLRPAILLGLGAAALVLGTIGFSQLRDTGFNFWDSAYRSATLFGLGGAVTPPVPTSLQIARIIAPVLTGYAAIGTLVILLRSQLRVAGIRLFVRDHVIVAGLGASGTRLAIALVDREPVVAIEASEFSKELPTAEARGVRVIAGDASDDVILHRAGIDHARTLFVSCGSDGTNVDVAVAATRAVPHRRRPLTIFVHLSDFGLWRSLAAEGATFGSRRAGVRLEYFNVFATGAQVLLERERPFAPLAHGDEPPAAHVLVVGLENIGEQLVLGLAREWRSLGYPAEALRITISGTESDLDVSQLRARYPAIDSYCQLGSRALEVESAAYQSGAAMLGEDGTVDVTRAYVCLNEEADALIGGLGLHSRGDTAGIPVTVALADEDAGSGAVLSSEEGRFKGVASFGVLTAATSDQLLLRGVNELIARAQHAQWLNAELAKGVTGARNPNAVPWEQLSEASREDNRRFADDLYAKLVLIECMLVPDPLRDPSEPQFEFDAAELETLSRHEHDRWAQSRIDDGWRYGPVRDNVNKLHDQLKPWEELDENNRDKDRDAVRELPQMLELAGFRIERLGGTARRVARTPAPLA
jgi:hypothetical protein